MFKLKKFLLIIAACLLALLPSCEKGASKRSVTVNRPNGTVSAEYNGNGYKAQIEYSDTGVLRANMLSPFEGITLTVDCNGCEIEYSGMKLAYSVEEMTDFCPFLGLYELLKTACYTEPESVRRDGEDYVMKFNDGAVECKAVTDADGALKKIETDEIKFTFEI